MMFEESCALSLTVLSSMKHARLLSKEALMMEFMAASKGGLGRGVLRFFLQSEEVL
jgi:hypothetical protein